jgi:hypothetical protein
MVPLVEPLLIEPPVEEEAPIDPAPIVPLVEPLLIEPEVSLEPPAAPFMFKVFSVLEPGVPGVDMVGGLGLLMVAFEPTVPLAADCAKARPEVQSEKASVAAINLYDMVIS